MNNLIYGNGDVSLDSNDSIIAIQFYFKGKIKINQVLPEEFTLYNSKNKIIIYSMGLYLLPDLLFTYNGNFKILKCIASDKNANKVDVSFANNYLGFWGKQNYTWATGMKWDSLDGDHIVGQVPVTQKTNLPELTKEQKRIVKRIKKRVRNG